MKKHTSPDWIDPHTQARVWNFGMPEEECNLFHEGKRTGLILLEEEFDIQVGDHLTLGNNPVRGLPVVVTGIHLAPLHDMDLTGINDPDHPEIYQESWDDVNPEALWASNPQVQRLSVRMAKWVPEKGWL